MKEILDKISIPTLEETQVLKCDEEVPEKEVIEVIKTFANNKSPGNDGLTKELYETFWDYLKTAYVPFRCISESGRLILDVIEMAEVI